MAADEVNNIFRYIYRGEEDEVISDEATHITVAEGVTVILAWAFKEHPNIVELICNVSVEKIEELAFYECTSLRRVIIPGVKEVDYCAFYYCPALTDVECGKLEIVKEAAFMSCESLRSINMPSARIVELHAFCECKALTNVKFGNELEQFEESAFKECESLERITIPLKDGLIADDDVFQGCRNLKQVDLVEEVELHHIIVALHLEEWRNDMNEEIDSIIRILSNARAGYRISRDDEDSGERQRRYEGGSDQFCAKLLVTKQNMIVFWTRLQLLSSLRCLEILR